VRTEHQIIGFDVQMHYFEVMQQKQIVFKRVEFLLFRILQLLTRLECELNRILVDDHVEAKTERNKRAALQHTADFCDTVFINRSSNSIWLILFIHFIQPVCLYGYLLLQKLKNIDHTTVSSIFGGLLEESTVFV